MVSTHSCGSLFVLKQLNINQKIYNHEKIKCSIIVLMHWHDASL